MYRPPNAGWSSSSRRQELPPNWEEIRQEVLDDANGVCEIRGPRCKGWATDVDHIRRGNDHRRSNLQAACGPCHLQKSSAEGVAQRAKKRAMRRRPQDRHPGSL